MQSTIKDILLENIRGKYFQHKEISRIILKVPEKGYINMKRLSNLEWALELASPLENRNYTVSLHQFDSYLEISEEEFNSIKELYNPKEEDNKPNLSAQKLFGLVVDKSKATKTANLNITPFPKESRLNPGKH